MKRLILFAMLLLAAGLGPALAQEEGISDEKLGPQAKSWVTEGSVAKVEPDQKQLTLTTEQGNLPLTITGGSELRDKDNKEIEISEFKEGDRVLTSFHQEGDKNQVDLLQKPAEMKGGRGGPEAKPDAPEIKPDQLGDASPAVVGEVEEIQAGQKKLTVSAEGARQPLEVTGESKVHGLDLGETGLGNIAQGDRVLVSFKREDGKAKVQDLYKLPKGESGESQGQ